MTNYWTSRLGLSTPLHFGQTPARLLSHRRETPSMAAAASPKCCEGVRPERGAGKEAGGPESRNNWRLGFPSPRHRGGGSVASVLPVGVAPLHFPVFRRVDLHGRLQLAGGPYLLRSSVLSRSMPYLLDW